MKPSVAAFFGFMGGAWSVALIIYFIFQLTTF
jgi:hypothetical protein